MSFSDSYLRRIITGDVVGDFPPFTNGSVDKIDKYIRKIIARLASDTLLIEADFSSHGSGFASYVEVRITKKDGSNTVVSNKNQRVTNQVTGLLLNISRLTPYWFYGGSSWFKTYEHGQQTGGGATFLTIENQATIDQEVWQPEQQLIEHIFREFRYELLTPEELTQPAPADITIPTILADEPYTVFDCFFYWED